MSWNDTLILTIQEEIHGRLCNDAFFADVPVLLQRTGDVENEVERALTVLNEKSGKCGACVVVLMPEVETPADERNLPGPQIEVVQSIQVLANELFNSGDDGTKKPAEQIAANIVNILHLHYDSCTGLLVADPRPIRPVQAQDGVVTYQVVVRSRHAFDRCNRVARPKMEAVDGKIVLSTATAEATIYYTTDGSYPGPANEAAIEYTEPFTPDVPSTIRVAAYAEGLIGSDVISADIVTL